MITYFVENRLCFNLGSDPTESLPTCKYTKHLTNNWKIFLKFGQLSTFVILGFIQDVMINISSLWLFCSWLRNTGAKNIHNACTCMWMFGAWNMKKTRCKQTVSMHVHVCISSSMFINSYVFFIFYFWLGCTCANQAYRMLKVGGLVEKIFS